MVNYRIRVLHILQLCYRTRKHTYHYHIGDYILLSAPFEPPPCIAESAVVVVTRMHVYIEFKKALLILILNKYHITYS